MIPSLRTRAAADIASYGQTLIGVTEQPPFVYTIGLHGVGLAEILALGDPLSVGPALNWLADEQRKLGRPWHHGEHFKDPKAECGVRFDLCGTVAKRRFTVQAGAYWGTEDYLLAQLVMPDPHGRWPEDPACAAPHAGQIAWRVEGP